MKDSAEINRAGCVVLGSRGMENGRTLGSREKKKYGCCMYSDKTKVRYGSMDNNQKSDLLIVLSGFYVLQGYEY